MQKQIADVCTKCAFVLIMYMLVQIEVYILG